MNPTVDEIFARYSDFMDKLAADVGDEDVRRLSRSEFEQKWVEVCEDDALKAEWIECYMGGYERARSRLARFMSDALPVSMYPSKSTDG